MDPRREMLKSLKKAYRQKKRRCVCVWKTLSILFLGLALCAAGAMALPELFRLDLGAVMGSSAVLVITVSEPLIFPAVAVACGVLLVVFAVLWGRGRKVLKRSREYLDYRTMKITLKAEKEAVK